MSLYRGQSEMSDGDREPIGGGGRLYEEISRCVGALAAITTATDADKPAVCQIRSTALS